MKTYRFIYNVKSKRIGNYCVDIPFLEELEKKLKGKRVLTSIYSDVIADTKELSNKEYEVTKDDILLIEANYLRAVSETYKYATIEKLKEMKVLDERRF